MDGVGRYAVRPQINPSRSLSLKTHAHSFCSVCCAGASYDFRKEIPAFANYEIEMTIGGFGDKWVRSACLFSSSLDLNVGD
jgi:hypothetical protein